MAGATTSTVRKLQIILLGTSGAGKSAMGNTILGEKKFKSLVSDQSVTIRIQTEKKTINGYEIEVTDTPGWHCTRLPEADVCMKLKDLTSSLEGPYAFLLVVSVGSFTAKEIDTLHKLKQVLGESFLSRTFIAFSHSDDLEFKTREQFIEEGGKDFQDMMQKCNFRHSFFNNRQRVEADVNELIEKMAMIVKVNGEENSGKQDTEYTAVDDVNKTSSCRRKQVDFQDCSKKRGRLQEECDHLSPGRCQKDIKVMLIGLKGVGKTSTIRNILNNETPHESATCHEYTGERFGVNLHLVECPGFDQNPDEIKASLQKGLSICAPGPDIIMIVLRVDRFTNEIKQAMEYVKDTLDEKDRKHAIILFTGEDYLDSKSIDQFIAESEELKMLVTAYDNRYHALNNREKCEHQVKKLMEIFLQIVANNDSKTQMQQEDSELGPSENSRTTQENLMEQKLLVTYV